MLTLPSTVSKASPLTFQLNKVALLAAASDSYWMNSANIKSVIVVYRSTAGNQRKRLEFDFTQATPTAVATWTGTARSDHDIEQIILVDFDGDTYTIPSANLPSGKGVSFGGGAPIVTPVVHNYVPNGAINDMVTDGTNVYIGGAFTALRFGSNNAAFISPTTAENQLKDQVSGKFPSFNGQINAFAFDGDSVLYVGGSFSAMDGQTRYGFVKLIKSGNDWVSDTDWNVGTNNGPSSSGHVVYSIVVLSDRILVGGAFGTWKNASGTNVTPNGIISVSKTTKAVLHLGGIGSGISVYDIKVDGEYAWVGGSFAPKKIKISNWEYQTLNLPAFQAGRVIYSMAVADDGIFCAGLIESPAFLLVKLSKSDGSLVPGFTSPFTGRATGEQALSLLLKDGSLYVGGTWNRAETGKNIVKLDPTTGAVISAFAPGSACFRGSSTGAVWSILGAGTSVIALGQFDGKATSGSAATNGNAVKLDATTGAADTSFDTLSALQGSSDLIRCGATYGSNLLIGGSFSGWGGYSRQGVAKLAKDSDGNWKVVEAFNPGSGGTTVNTLALSGSDLYIGGTFTTWAGSTRNRVAKLNATTGALDPSFGVGVFTSGQTTGQFNGVLNTVNKLLVDGSDLVIGGAFTTYSKKSSASSTTSPATPNWIRVNTATNTESVPSSGSGVIIYEMILDGENMFVGGNFTTWGGASVNRLVLVDKNTGTRNTSFAPANYSGYFTKMILDGSRLYCVIAGYSSAKFFALSKSDGSLSINYVNQASNCDSGKWIDDSNYVYFFGGVVGQKAIAKRFLKSTGEQDLVWNGGTSAETTLSTAVAGFAYTCAAFVGNEIILGGNFSGTGHPAGIQPSQKRLYSVQKESLVQNTNI